MNGGLRMARGQVHTTADHAVDLHARFSKSNAQGSEEETFVGRWIGSILFGLPSGLRYETDLGKLEMGGG